MGRPSNLSRLIVERAMRAAEAAVTRHNQVGNVRFSQAAPPSPGAVRMRRYRERRKRAGVMIEIEIVGTALDDLTALGWLDPARRGDRAAVRGAIVALAERALVLRIRPGG